MDIKKSVVVLNGFIHDFAAGYWLAAIMAVFVLHRNHQLHPEVAFTLNGLEHFFFWQSVVAMVIILATGAGRTFTYVENWYGPDAEKVRRRMLMVKHIVLFAAFGAGYLFVWGKVFH
jgi:uncharacterized membrane protein